MSWAWLAEITCQAPACTRTTTVLPVFHAVWKVCEHCCQRISDTLKNFAVLPTVAGAAQARCSSRTGALPSARRASRSGTGEAGRQCGHAQRMAAPICWLGCAQLLACLLTPVSTQRPLGVRAARKFQLLKSFPNVLISPHSAFLTTEALANIAATTVQNLKVRPAPWLTDGPLTAGARHVHVCLVWLPEPGVDIQGLPAMQGHAGV